LTDIEKDKGTYYQQNTLKEIEANNS